MSARSIRDAAAIVGMGLTQFGELWDRGPEDLIVEAALAAVEDAGMTLSDVDAFWLGTRATGMSGLTLSRPLKLAGRPVTRVENFCATGSEAFRNASYAVAAGAYDVVMALGVEKMKDAGTSGLVPVPVPEDGTRTELTGPAYFSLLVPAYAERHGVSREELRRVLTHIAAKNHFNGARNPKAQFRKEVAAETIERSPRVAGDLRVFDCSGVSDGAAAAVIVRGEDAPARRADPLYVKGLALVAGDGSGQRDTEYDFTTFPEVVAAGRQAYAQAGVEDPARELALAEVHDCFTPTELVLMEDLGFSARGSAWKDVLAGRFDLRGDLAVNPDGGLKSFGHPVGASGLRMLYECWLQLRGAAPAERQIDLRGRTLGLTHNLGGPPGDCVSFVSVVGTQRG
ncbi:acetyl-CoA acetyltransferase [Amycolatopsis thermophila]|uniref:Acetyl-CoA C-acetyltransferase n=1 Tax=Amycolatopsis thermophila TaxID=206084 RepID=A0ABU0F5E0_9PSEU|nr:acetyl-CoA acetyltransferase [Amycolatopsis thermophila]MDQ0382799.1 acetyl-CoA C-acetyltransferase [Amycolatopsis thermophila]